jgi:hypothetical protein
VKWELSTLAAANATYQFFISLLIVVSVPNSLVTRAGGLVGSNQSISSSFDSNSKRMFHVSEVEVVNISSSKRDLPVLH